MLSNQRSFKGEQNLAFCGTCKRSVEFTTRYRQAQGQRDGRSYRYRKPTAICPQCGSELDHGPYRRAAEAAFEEACANGAGLITPEQIRELPRKYAIGKRPLSRLLGWGELTYTRLLDGNIPTREHSDELLQLLDNPEAFSQLVQRGYERGVITEAAYKRSMSAIGKMLGSGVADVKRLSAVADLLCVLAEGELTPTALQVLVYYANGYGAALLERPLFEAKALASPMGPCYPHLSKLYSFADIQATYAHLAGPLPANRPLPAAASSAPGSGPAPNEPVEADEPAWQSDASAAEAHDADVGTGPEAHDGPRITVADVAALFDKAESVRTKKGKKGKKYKKALKAAKDAQELLNAQVAAAQDAPEPGASRSPAKPAADATPNAARPDTARPVPNVAAAPVANYVLDGLKSPLSADEVGVIDRMYETFGNMSAQSLRDRACSEPPWAEARAAALAAGEDPDSAPISPEALGAYLQQATPL